MRREDFIGQPCRCHDCVVAGVAGKEIRYDSQRQRWLHGRELAAWYRAKAEFDATAARIRAAMKEAAGGASDE